MRQVNAEVKRLTVMNDDEIMTEAKNIGAPFEVLKILKRMVNFLLLTLQLVV